MWSGRHHGHALDEDERPQGLGHRGGAAVALARQLGHQAAQHLRKARRQVPAQPLDRRRLVHHVLDELLVHRPGAERRLARQQEVQGAAEAVHVGAGIDAAGVQRLLRRQEVRRADDGAAHCQADGGRSFLGLLLLVGQAEVQHLDDALRGQEQVVRLHVAVDQAELMSVMKTERRLPYVLAGQRRLQRALLSQETRQVGAFEVLHRQVGRAVGLASVVDADHVGMIEMRDDFGLALEAVQGVAGAHALGADHLHGRQPFQAALACLVHPAHAPFAKQIEDDIVIEDQFAPLPRSDLLNLEAREPIAADQFLGQGLRFGEAGHQCADQFLGATGLQKLRRLDRLRQGPGGDRGHGWLPSKRVTVARQYFRTIVTAAVGPNDPFSRGRLTGECATGIWGLGVARRLADCLCNG